jgi:hypothetical protein
MKSAAFFCAAPRAFSVCLLLPPEARMRQVCTFARSVTVPNFFTVTTQ